MDELHLLRTTRNTTGTVPPAVLAAGREKLMQKAADESAHQTPAPVLHPVRPWRRTLFASAAAVALVATLVAVDVMGSGERPGATAEAADVLNDAAASTIATSDPVLEPGQYLMIDTKAVYPTYSYTETGEVHSWLVSSDGQLYIPADRSAEWVWNREQSKPLQFFDEASRGEAEQQASEREAAGEPIGGEVWRAPAGRWQDTEPLFLSGIPLDAMNTVPRDPQELLDLIYERTQGKGPSADEEAFVTIAAALRTGVVPADLRAALYQAASLIPGLTVGDTQATLDGRQGVALGMATHRYEGRIEMIIDPVTGQLIGERETVLEDVDGVPAGTVSTWTAVTTSVVDAAP